MTILNYVCGKQLHVHTNYELWREITWDQWNCTKNLGQHAERS